MKEINERDCEVGVVIARLQVDELTEGHHQLFQHVISKHNRVILFLGLTAATTKITRKNALDFKSRKLMVAKHYPDIDVLYIKNVRSDTEWSHDLDGMIKDLVGAHQKPILYGSRDSFINHYFGQFPTQELMQENFISGSARRKHLANMVAESQEARGGAFWALYNQFPGCLPTVDVAIFDTPERRRILLGRKKKEKEFRLPGVFVRSRENWESAAERAARDETKVSLIGLKYAGSHVVDDWKYWGEDENPTTTLFTAVKGEEEPEPDPKHGMVELKWFGFTEQMLGNVVPEHIPLLRCLLKEGSDE